MPLLKLKVEDHNPTGELHVNPVQQYSNVQSLQVAPTVNPTAYATINVPKFDPRNSMPPGPAPRPHGFGQLGSDAADYGKSLLGYSGGKWGFTTPFISLVNSRGALGNIWEDIGAGIYDTKGYQAVKQYTPKVAGYDIPLGQYATDFVESPAHTIQRFGNVGTEEASYTGNMAQQLGQGFEDALNVVTFGRGGSVFNALKAPGKEALKKLGAIAAEDVATGAGYGVAMTAQQEGATGKDYLTNAGIGAVAAPVIHIAGEGAVKGASVALRPVVQQLARGGAGARDLVLQIASDPALMNQMYAMAPEVAAAIARGDHSSAIAMAGSMVFKGTKGFKEAKAVGKMPKQSVTGEDFFHIADDKAKVNPKIYDTLTGKTLTVGDILDHSALKGANPELFNIPVRAVTGTYYTGKYSHSPRPYVEINQALIKAAQKENGSGPATDELLQTTLHELTHAEEYRAQTQAVDPKYKVDPVIDPEGYRLSPTEANARAVEANSGRGQAALDNMGNDQFYKNSGTDPNATRAQMAEQEAMHTEAQYDPYYDSYKVDPRKSLEEKLAGLRDTEIKPLRTNKVVRDELHQTRPIRKELEREAKGVKKTIKVTSKEITALEQQRRKDFYKTGGQEPMPKFDPNYLGTAKSTEPVTETTYKVRPKGKEELAPFNFDPSRTVEKIISGEELNPGETYRQYFNKEKGIDGDVVSMTPDEYLKSFVGKEGQYSYKSVEDIVKRTNPKTVAKYAADMQKGEKFPMVQRHLDHKGDVTVQEGFHRALAAKKAGVKTIPVEITFPVGKHPNFRSFRPTEKPQKGVRVVASKNTERPSTVNLGQRDTKALAKNLVPENKKAAKNREMVARREGIKAESEAHLAAVQDDLEKITSLRQGLGLEARRATKKPPKMTDEQLQMQDDYIALRDTVLYGKSARDAMAELDTGTKDASKLLKVRRNLLDDKPSEIVSNMLSSKNKAARTAAKTAQAFYGALGKTEQQMDNSRALIGARDSAKHEATSLYDRGKNYTSEEKSLVSKFLDPELNGGKKLTLDELPDYLRADAQMLDAIRNINHDLNYLMGKIGESTYEKGKDTYLTRSVVEHEFPQELQGDMNRAKSKIKGLTNLMRQRVGLTEEHQARLYDDPFYAVAKQTEFTDVNIAVMKYADNIMDNSPQLWRDFGDADAGTHMDGFVKLSDDPSYGRLAGKWLRDDEYTQMAGFHSDNAVIQSVIDLLNAVESFKPRQWAKAAKTVLSPIQHLVNRVYNYVVAMANGIPLHQFNHYERMARKMLKDGNDPLIVGLRREGRIGLHVSGYEYKQLAQQRVMGEKPGKIGQIFDKASNAYGLTDDGAKLATILYWTREKGFTLKEAMRRATDSMQDYPSVGQAWNVSAKLPIVGKPFGRFTGDFLRVMHKTAVTHPLAAITLGTGYLLTQNLASQLSGESEEDRKTRENRMGSGHLPFTNISTEFQTPWGAVDIRRFLGPVSIAQAEYDAVTGGLNAFNPFNTQIGGKIKTSDGEERTDVRGLATDPLLGPLVSVATDMNFTGDRIRKPQQYSKPGEKVSVGTQASNVAQYLGHSYAPPSANDAYDVVQAALNKPTYYNSQKPNAKPADLTKQTIKTLTGIRVTQYGHDEAEKSRSAGAYYDAIDEARNTLGTRDDIRQFDDLMGRAKTPEGKTIQESPVESVKNSEILYGNDKVREAFKTAMQKQADHDPKWDLSDDKLKTYLAYDINLPGSAERWKIKEDNPWIEDFQSERADYFNRTIKEQKTIPTGPQYPKFDDQTKTSLKEYNKVADDDKGAYLADHPEVTAAFKEMGKYTNEVRAARGAAELDEYPEAPAGFQDLMKTYNSLPKNDGPKGGSKTRSLWIQSHPNEWAMMTGYFTKLAVYHLAQEGAKVQLKGVDVTQEFLKNAYSLGQYNITKNADGTYSLGGDGSGGSSGSGGSGKRYYGYGRKGRGKDGYSEPGIGMSSRHGSPKPEGKISIKATTYSVKKKKINLNPTKRFRIA